MKPKLVLVGAGGHARSCIDVIELQDIFQIAGLIGLPSELNSTISHHSVIGVDDDLPRLAKELQYAFIAVGQIKRVENRQYLFGQAIKFGFKLPTIVSPNAYVSPHAMIGRGSIVMHGAVINSGVTIGDNCIINSRALIEHDTWVDSHCHISTGAILNGGVKVGAKTFIGSGSIVKESAVIGEGCLVGMGVSLRRNLANQEQFTG